MSEKEATEKLKRKEYEKELHKLQVELCCLQDWTKESGERVITEGLQKVRPGMTVDAAESPAAPVSG